MRKLVLASLFVPVVVAGACDGDTATQTPADSAGGPGPGMGHWERRAAMPDTPRMYVGVTAVREKLFVVGGSRLGQTSVPSAAVQAYDPKSDKWEAVPDLPQPYWMPNVATVGGKLYVLGAVGVLEAVEYDLDQKRWTPRKPVPTSVGRGAAAVGVYGNSIVVAGGITPGRSANMLNTGMRVPDVFLYDVSRDAWETLPEMPLPRGYAMGAVLGDTFWMAGGSTDFVRTDQVDAFDLKARRWLEKPPLPYTLSSGAVGVVKGRIVLVGGIATSTGTITPDTQVLDPATGAWAQVAPMLTPRFAMGAAVIGDRLYVPGGAAAGSQPNVFGPSSELEVFVP